MNNSSFSEFEFEKNLFKKITVTVTENKQRISYIAQGGINKNEIYQKAIAKFQIELKKGLQDNDSFTWKGILYITNEIATDKSIFNTIMKYNEFDTFILLVKEYKKITIYKKLFTIYFKYYNTLSNEGAITVLRMNLKAILRIYKGRNKYILNLIDKKDYIFGEISDLLEYYDYDFEKIKFDFHLQDDFEFSKVILNFKIVQALELLDYDEDNEELFSDIILKKEIFFDAGITLKSYVADYLIGIVMSENKPFPNWQIFILKLLGDPRSIAMFTSESRTWDIIGEDKKDFFIKSLSKDDLKLFLEALSDSNSDNNYHYRKAFWMKFIDKVIFAKLLIGNDAYLTLSDEMRRNFNLNNDSYGRLKGLANQSAVYIDFGRIKIIEFTYSGQARGYLDCPINLHRKEYSKRELDSLPLKHSCLFSVIHSSAASYGWQSKLLEYMNRYLGTRVSRQDIEIDDDRKKVDTFNNIHSNKVKEKNIHINNDIKEPYKEKYKTCKKCDKVKPFNEFSLIGNGIYNPYCTDCLIDQEDTSVNKPTNKSILSIINTTINKFK